MDALRNLWEILSKPDNVPIALMLFLVIFFVWFSIYLGRKNDKLKEKYEKEIKEGKRSKLPEVVDIFYPEDELKYPKKIHTWPYLVRIEFLCAILLTAFLVVWSIVLDAPLEEPANPNVTPNPAKAPWYFLGLQELLVYFDPWIAGVLLPTLIIIGLMVIPYVDFNTKSSGYYTFKERKFAIFIFLFGFLILRVLLIIIGTFIRGPGWMWFWPWEKWDPTRTLAETNKNLHEFFGVHLKHGEFDFIGMFFVVGYFVGAFTLSFFYLKWKHPQFLEKLGFVRFNIIAFFFWFMMLIPIKIILRLTINLKYFWVTPWFNV